MRAKREYRNRDETEVAVLDALVDRGRDGMTVFELRAQADVAIDNLEATLPELKDEGLIDVDQDDGRTLIKPDDRVIPDPDATDTEPSLGERLREAIDRLRP